MIKRKYIKIFVMMTISILLLNGCKKTDVSYDVKLDDDDSVIKSDLSVPDSCTYNFKVGESGLDNICLETDNIIVPDVEKLYIEYFDKINKDNEYKRTVAESIFDKEDGIYVYNGKMSPEMLMELADYYNVCIEKAVELNDSLAKEIYEGLSSDVVNQLSSATELEAAGSYGDNCYIGYIDGKSYLLDFDIEGGGFELERYPEEFTIDMIDEDDKTYASCFTTYGDGYEQDLINTGDLNISDMSQEEAIEEAEKFLDSIGITDVVPVETAVNEWQCYDLLWGQEESDTVYDGYYITFTNDVNSVIPYMGYYDWVGSLCENGIYREGLTVQTYEISLSDSGIVKAVCHDQYRKNDIVESDNQLLTWEEMISTADLYIGEYYSDKNVSGTISFNYVELSYFMIQEADETYALRPVWIFLTLDDEALYYNSSTYPTEMLVIDAVTGIPVDLN